MNTIAIDCGASFIKCGLFDGEKLIEKLEKKTSLIAADGKLYSIDALFKLVCGIILEFGRKCGNYFTLCVSNEMHGFVLTDDSFNPVVDYISWQKELGNILIDGISSKELLQKNQDFNIKKTGMPIRAGLPSCNLFYLLRSKVIECSKKLYFFTLGDFIIAKLSKTIPCCHPTNAAATGLFDLNKNDWNKELINYIGASWIVFPKVGNNSFEFEWNGKKIKSIPAFGDQQVALFGAGFSKKGELSFNLGTGAQISTITDRIELSNNSIYQVRPYFNNMYLKTIPHIPSGRALNVYFRFFKSVLDKFGVNVSDEEIWDKILAADNENDLIISLSFFENAVDNYSVGSINNILEDSLNFDELASAVIKQAGDNFVNVSRRLVKKEQINKIVFSGGVARRIERIRNIILKEYKVDFCVSSEETLIGLNKLALLANNQIED